MIFLDLLLIQVIVVCIVDISGFIDSVKSGIKWVLTKGRMSSSDYRLKPFDCSLCMTFWCCIIYLLVTGNFSLVYIAYSLLLACLAGITKEAIFMVESALIKIIRLIERLMEKI